jgi:ketosteroid isomerase-like protein
MPIRPVSFRIDRCAVLVCLSLVFAGCTTPAPRPDGAALKLQVASAERAFAKTMATRDHAAFVAFLADDAVFFIGPKPLRGKAQVAAAWKRFYERPEAPFSWEPAEVEVLDDGTLAISSGPVRDANGKLVATFTSIWRQEAPGVWRVVFDKGNEACDCAKAP